MMECIDQRRNEKIEHEHILLQYKLQALERTSVGERAQHHSQYVQTVRDIRDRTLEQANKEWYQIQRERRSWDGDLPEYMYMFPTRRSHQIAQQTAYNAEVSILSGIAKYVGFPAAPEICGAPLSDIDDDLRSMGVSHNWQRHWYRHTDPASRLHHNLKPPNNFSRQILVPTCLCPIYQDRDFLPKSNSLNKLHGLTRSIQLISKF